MLLEGKRIILTGGATGIGRAAAQRVTRDGAKLAFSDVNDDDAATCPREIKGMGGDARYWRVDVVHEDQVKSAVGEAVDWLGGGADVLLNIARAAWRLIIVRLRFQQRRNSWPDDGA